MRIVDVAVRQCYRFNCPICGSKLEADCGELVDIGGDTCLVTRGKDKGKRCIVLYKAGHTIKYDHRIGIVVVKPEDYGNLFESSTVTYRYFKLFSHTELRKTLF